MRMVGGHQHPRRQADAVQPNGARPLPPIGIREMGNGGGADRPRRSGSVTFQTEHFFDSAKHIPNGLGANPGILPTWRRLSKDR